MCACASQEIARAAADYATAAASLEARRNELREYQHRLESQQGENAVRARCPLSPVGVVLTRARACVCDVQEVQGSITAADRVNTKQREDYQRQQQKLNEFKDEVEVLKNELQKAANDLLQRRCVCAVCVCGVRICRVVACRVCIAFCTAAMRARAQFCVGV